MLKTKIMINRNVRIMKDKKKCVRDATPKKKGILGNCFPKGGDMVSDWKVQICACKVFDKSQLWVPTILIIMIIIITIIIFKTY